MLKNYRVIPMLVLGVIILILDQVTKYLVATRMEIGESIRVIGEFFRITSHRNQGAAWGMLQGQMTFFYIITIVVILLLIYMYFKEAKEKFVMQLAITFIVFGAIGNFIDRIRLQEVVDFFDFLIINYPFPIFNVADSALTIGVILMLIHLLFLEKREKDSV